MVLFPFPAGRGSTSILSSKPTGYSLRPVSGTYFFANASFNKGHTHPLFSGLHDPDDIALPPQMIRWPQDSPSVLPVALVATRRQQDSLPARTRSPHHGGRLAQCQSRTLASSLLRTCSPQLLRRTFISFG